MLETKSVLKNREIVQEPKISSKDLLMRKFNSQFTELEKDSISALRLSSPISTDRTEEEKTLMKELEKASSSTQLPIATEILQILDPIQPLANHLSELLRRPSAYYPLRYQDNVSVRLPHVVQMLGLAQMFMIQAQANLVHGSYCYEDDQPRYPSSSMD